MRDTHEIGHSMPFAMDNSEPQHMLQMFDRGSRDSSVQNIGLPVADEWLLYTPDADVCRAT